jgi:hypothetical protein
MSGGILMIISLLLIFNINAKEVLEDGKWYESKVKSIESTLEPIEQTDYIDLKAVGDSAWSYGARPQDGLPYPLEPNFDYILESIDPDKKLFRGDLSFINWESVTGEYCDFIRPTVSFYFLSHPESLAQAINHGFNLVGFANNHAQDCNEGRSFMDKEPVHGAIMSEQVALRLQEDFKFSYSGVGQDPWRISNKKYNLKGQEVDVSFSSFTIISWDIPNSAFLNMNDDYQEKFDVYLEKLKLDQSPLKIVAIHTQDRSGHNKPEKEAYLLMKKLGERLIKEAGVDIIYGQGAHSYGGVRIFEENNKKSVFITSLGNFIHDGLRSIPDNYLSRILLDDSLKLKQIQIYPFRNNGESSRVQFWSEAECQKTPMSNFKWQTEFNEFCTIFASF